LAEGFLEFTANQGIQGRSGNFTFNPGKSGEKERYFENQGSYRVIVVSF